MMFSDAALQAIYKRIETAKGKYTFAESSIARGAKYITDMLANRPGDKHFEMIVADTLATMRLALEEWRDGKEAYAIAQEEFAKKLEENATIADTLTAMEEEISKKVKGR